MPDCTFVLLCVILVARDKVERQRNQGKQRAVIDDIATPLQLQGGVLKLVFLFKSGL